MHRRTLVAGLAAAPALVMLSRHVFAQEQATLEGDVVSTNQGDLVIHPVSHASLVLGWGGHVIYVDPVGGAALYEGLPPPTGILVTHAHGDHFDPETLTALAADGARIVTTQEVFDKMPAELQSVSTAMANGTTGSISGIPVDVIAAYNTTEDRLQYHPKGVGNGYVLLLGDTRVYIAGDTEDTPEMRALTDIAVAFLPMNLPYTMTIEQAADAVAQFRPRIVYPYHSQGSDLEAFTALVGSNAEVRIREWYPAA